MPSDVSKFMIIGYHDVLIILYKILFAAQHDTCTILLRLERRGVYMCGMFPVVSNLFLLGNWFSTILSKLESGLETAFIGQYYQSAKKCAEKTKWNKSTQWQDIKTKRSTYRIESYNQWK